MCHPRAILIIQDGTPHTSQVFWIRDILSTKSNITIENIGVYKLSFDYLYRGTLNMFLTTSRNFK